MKLIGSYKKIFLKHNEHCWTRNDWETAEKVSLYHLSPIKKVNALYTLLDDLFNHPLFYAFGISALNVREP